MTPVLFAVKLLFSLLPVHQAELQHRLGWLRQVWSLVKRAIVVKVRSGVWRREVLSCGDEGAVGLRGNCSPRQR